MGFRMRKSIRVAPGVRLNVSKRGVGVSAGAGGLRYSVNSSGRRTTSVRSGVPGVSYQSTRGGGRRATPARAGAQAPSIVKPAKPGLFAPKGHKALYKALQSQSADLAQKVGEQDSAMLLPAFTIAGLLLISSDGDRALPLLAKAFAAGDAASTSFFQTYVSGSVQVKIADGVSALVPLGREAVGLVLAELYQSEERFDEAIDVVEQLEPTTHSAVSLAELYAETGRFNDIVELTERIANEDDASALLLVFRGVALREQGYKDAAHEAFKEALKSRSRAATIRHHALFERATNFEAQGKKAMARKDLERILAEDSTYPGVRERLDAT
jgi:tetratricopeptide (TPR) repeat protein